MATSTSYLSLSKPGDSEHWDVSKYNGNMDKIDAGVKKAVIKKVSKSSVSSLPTSISNSDITADMECVKAVLSNPAAQRSEWTVTTAAGSVTISGTISGTTNITLYLETTI